MIDTSPVTTYVSRVIAAPPAIGVEVFDACVTDHLARSWRSDRWSAFAAGGADLRLDDRHDEDRWTLRSCGGVLRGGRFGRPVPVELELMAWSSVKTELGLRLSGRRYRPAPGYFAAAWRV